jgi:hypothetical protein
LPTKALDIKCKGKTNGSRLSDIAATDIAGIKLRMQNNNPQKRDTIKMPLFIGKAIIERRLAIILAKENSLLKNGTEPRKFRSVLEKLNSDV